MSLIWCKPTGFRSVPLKGNRKVPVSWKLPGQWNRYFPWCPIMLESENETAARSDTVTIWFFVVSPPRERQVFLCSIFFMRRLHADALWYLCCQDIPLPWYFPVEALQKGVEELHFYSNASYERREYANFHNFPAVSYICSRSASTRQIFCDFSVQNPDIFISKKIAKSSFYILNWQNGPSSKSLYYIFYSWIVKYLHASITWTAFLLLRPN